MHASRLWIFALGLYVSAVSSNFASAQYFARNSVQLPSLGWMAMDSSFGSLNNVPWGINDQVQIGTGYARDLIDLKLWWLNETALGFGSVNVVGLPTSRIIVSFHGATGIKYNFRTDRVRPFAGCMLEIFQLFRPESGHGFSLELISTTWAGVRPMLGLEWMFESDMSLEVETGYILLINFEDPLRHSAMARISYRIYF